jgi:uncharacterized membrane protein HdeD (DUF308 family)
MVGIVAASRHVSTFLWILVTALLPIAVGAMLVWKPFEGAFSLTLVLTAFFVAEGVFQVVSSFSYRDAIPDSWGWMLMSGIADLLLAGIIIWAWPTSAQWALGLVVGINLITSGTAVVMLAIEGRDN